MSALRWWLAASLLCGWLGAAATRAEPPPLDLNRATPEQLEQLPGIGQKKAEAIVALRKQKPLTRVSQLLLVRGIGHKTLERLRRFVTVKPVVPAGTPPPESGKR